MATPRSAWGIDIGNRALKAVKLMRSPEGLVVSDFAFIEHETVLSEAGDNRDSLIQTSLAKFVGRHNTRKTPVAVGVSGQSSFARFVKLPPVEEKKIPEIVKFEAIQQIPFPLDDVEWSYQLFDREDDPETEVGIFAMRKELVNQHVHFFSEVDLDVHAVQMDPLAVYNAIQRDGRLDKGASLILDLGADSCDLIIADNDSIWMRSLDIGGNNFTEVLQKAFKIDFEKAEEMKRNARSSKYARQIYQAMRPIFGELVSEVQRSIGFFSSARRDTKIRKIITVGGGFRLNGLTGYLQKNLQMPVEKPTSFNAKGPEEPEVAAAYTEHTLSGVAAYGLALQLLGEAPVNSSLLPTHIRKDKMWKDKTKYFVLASAIVVASAGLAYGASLFNTMQLNADETRINNAQAALREGQGLVNQWQEVTGSGQAELQQVRNVTKLVEGRDLWGSLLVDLAAALPKPTGPVAEGLATGDAEKVKSVPRGQRQMVLLDNMESVYTSNLYQIANAELFVNEAERLFANSGYSNRNSRRQPPAYAGGGPGAPEGAPAVEPQFVTNPEARGFLIRVTLISPNANGGRYIEDNVLPAFDQIRPDAENPNLKYRVAAAEISAARQFKDNPERLRKLESDYQALAQATATQEPQRGGASPAYRGYTPSNRGFGRTPGGYTPSRPGGFAPRGQTLGEGEGNPAYLDRLTNESMLNDWEVVVVLAVELDPEPYQPEPETESEETTVAGVQP